MYLYDWAGGLISLIALRMFHGVSWAISTNSIATAVTDIIPDNRRGEGMGWFGMFTTLGMAIGPIVGVWMTDNTSFQTLFLLATCFSIGAFLFTLPTKIPFTSRAVSGRMSFLEMSVLPISLVTFLMTISFGGIIAFLPLFAATIDVNAGTFFLAYAITLGLVRPIAGKLTDRYGEAVVILPALCVSTVACLVLAISNGLLSVLIAAVLYGIGFGAAQPALQTATINLAPPERRGAANASFLTAFDLGVGLGSIALGAVSQYMGYRALFCATSLSGIAALIMFALYRRGIFGSFQSKI
jgi:MFS family permease